MDVIGWVRARMGESESVQIPMAVVEKATHDGSLPRGAAKSWAWSPVHHWGKVLARCGMIARARKIHGVPCLVIQRLDAATAAAAGAVVTRGRRGQAGDIVELTDAARAELDGILTRDELTRGRALVAQRNTVEIEFAGGLRVVTTRDGVR